MVYLIHERLSSATACSPRPTCHVRYRRRIMWIFHFVQFACTECSGVERERSPPGATRDPGAPTTSKRGSTATGGFTMTAPRMFSTYSGSSATSFVAHGRAAHGRTAWRTAWAWARRRAATDTLMPPESPLLARRSERRLAHPCRFCRALCPSLALGHARRQQQLQEAAAAPMGYLRLLWWSKSQLPSLLHAVSFYSRTAVTWQSVRLSIQDIVNMALDPAGSPGHCISGTRRLGLHERHELSQ